MKVIYEEFMQLFKEHSLLIAITAVIAVPILYAGMFLWAFWDPYDHLPDLPIAVVNEDIGAVEDGEKLELGKELVDKLKEEPEFDFHFVERSEGYKGLDEEEYYILIEIPKDFSENATTLMDDQPKKLDLVYVPNESFNFLASQIGETAMLQIKVALQEKITETYAETIFDKIEEVAEGLDDASEATEELHDGAEKLQDGSVTIMENLHKLADSTIEFKDGMHSAGDGASELTDGTEKLADGMGQLGAGSNDLLKASKDVQKGANDLASGASAANAGMHELEGNLPALLQGTNQLHAGVSEMQKQLPIQLASEIKQKLTESSKAMDAGITELQTGITSSLENQLAPGLSAGISEELTKNIAGQLNNEATVTKLAAKVVAEQKKSMLAISEGLIQAGIPKETVDAVMTEMGKNSPGEKDVAAKIQASMQEELPSEAEIQAQIEAGLKTGINQGIDQTVAGINEGFKTFKTEVNNNLNSATAGLENEIKSAVNPAFNELKAGVNQLNDGQAALAGGVKQLADGTKQLQTGSSQLASGQSEYVKNMDMFTNKFGEANNGIADLVAGTNTLLGGLKQLEDGSLQLADGSKQLADGSDELVDGMDELLDGTAEFNEEMSSAAEEANDIQTDDDTYNMMATPVEVQNEKINEVPNYGTGFAPYFLSLGLFVGALLLSIVYPLREPAGTPKNGVHWFFTKFSVLFVVGVLQAIIAAGILLIGLKLEVQSVPLFFLFAIITSLTFITLIQFLVTCLDDPGRFIAIIVLILQLTTSAGTFPLELIPKALQPFNLLLPMTYSVAGFKAVVSSGHYGVMWQNVGILLGFTIVFMLLTISYFVVMYKRKYERSQEENAA